MQAFVKLTRKYDGTPLMLLSETIVSVAYDGGGAHVVAQPFGARESGLWSVKESVDEVMAAMEEAEYRRLLTQKELGERVYPIREGAMSMPVTAASPVGGDAA